MNTLMNTWKNFKKVKRELYGKVVTHDDRTKVRKHIYGQSYLPLNIEFFFSQAFAVEIEDTVRISVEMFADGDLGRSTDEFWATPLRLAHWDEQARCREQPSRVNRRVCPIGPVVF
jgi:hypothetical protein